MNINLSYLIINRAFIFLLIFQIKYSISNNSNSNNDCQVQAASQAQSNGYDEIGLTVAEIARLRGYNATNHYVTTTDGYILNAVQITNPMINNGTPLPETRILLMVHGVHTNGRFFVINSVGAKPSYHADKNVTQMSIKELEDLLLDDPTTNSLGFTVVNFGWQLWILNRRGSMESRNHVSYKKRRPNKNPNETIQKPTPSINNNPLSYLSELARDAFQTYENSNYWNYSLDQQALYDLPETIDFILKETNQTNLSVVGHSAGGAAFLMTFSIHPRIMRRIKKALLWAPALDLGGTKPENTLLYQLGSYLFTKIYSPMPLPAMIPIMNSIIMVACWTRYGQMTICQTGLDNNFGWGGGQQNTIPGILSDMLDVCSYGEYAQLAQSFVKGRTHHLDFENRKQNMISYGSSSPPVYNISTFDTEGISIWYGATDSLVQPKAIEQILADLRNGDKVERHFLKGDHLYFNHFSFCGHKDVARLLIIPSLKTLYS